METIKPNESSRAITAILATTRLTINTLAVARESKNNVNDKHIDNNNDNNIIILNDQVYDKIVISKFLFTIIVIVIFVLLLSYLKYYLIILFKYNKNSSTYGNNIKKYRKKQILFNTINQNINTMDKSCSNKDNLTTNLSKNRKINSEKNKNNADTNITNKTGIEYTNANKNSPPLTPVLKDIDSDSMTNEIDDFENFIDDKKGDGESSTTDYETIFSSEIENQSSIFGEKNEKCEEKRGQLCRTASDSVIIPPSLFGSQEQVFIQPNMDNKKNLRLGGECILSSMAVLQGEYIQPLLNNSDGKSKPNKAKTISPLQLSNEIKEFIPMNNSSKTPNSASSRFTFSPKMSSDMVTHSSPVISSAGYKYGNYFKFPEVDILSQITTTENMKFYEINETKRRARLKSISLDSDTHHLDNENLSGTINKFINHHNQQQTSAQKTAPVQIPNDKNEQELQLHTKTKKNINNLKIHLNEMELSERYNNLTVDEKMKDQSAVTQIIAPKTPTLQNIKQKAISLDSSEDNQQQFLTFQQQQFHIQNNNNNNNNCKRNNQNDNNRYQSMPTTPKQYNNSNSIYMKLKSNQGIDSDDIDDQHQYLYELKQSKSQNDYLNMNLNVIKQTTLSSSNNNLKTLPEITSINDFSANRGIICAENNNNCNFSNNKNRSILQRRGSNHSLTLNLDSISKTKTMEDDTTTAAGGIAADCATAAAVAATTTNLIRGLSTSNYSLGGNAKNSRKNLLQRRGSNTSLTLNLQNNHCYSHYQHLNFHQHNYNQQVHMQQQNQHLLNKPSQHTTQLYRKRHQHSSTQSLNRFNSHTSLNVFSSTASTTAATTPQQQNQYLSQQNQLSKQQIQTNTSHTGKTKKGLLERRNSNASLTLNIHKRGLSISNCNLTQSTMMSLSSSTSSHQNHLHHHNNHKTTRKFSSSENLKPSGSLLSSSQYHLNRSHPSHQSHLHAHNLGQSSVHHSQQHNNANNNNQINFNNESNDDIDDDDDDDEVDDEDEEHILVDDDEDEDDEEDDEDNLLVVDDYIDDDTGNYMVHDKIKYITTKPLSPHTTSEDFKIYLANIQFLQNATNPLNNDYLNRLGILFQKQHINDYQVIDDNEKKLLVKIHQEFWDLPTNYQEKPLVFGSQSKNRYKTILPNEHSRVVLQCEYGQTNEPYINANYIKGPDYTHNAYIATQGPLANTLYDFWLMIYQNLYCNQQKIIMLTDFIENNRQKCSIYFPRILNDSLTVTNSSDFSFHIKNIYILYKKGYTITKLEITHKYIDSNNIEIIKVFGTYHYWYPDWPDGLAPNNINVLLDMSLDLLNNDCFADFHKLELEQCQNSEIKPDEFEQQAERLNENNISSDKTPIQLTVSLPVNDSNNATTLESTSPCSSTQSQLLPIIHCSAGIGRTGCLIAILNGLKQIQTTLSKSDVVNLDNICVDILGIVCNLRLQRGGMVQNSEQYELIHRTLCIYQQRLKLENRRSEDLEIQTHDTNDTKQDSIIEDETK